MKTTPPRSKSTTPPPPAPLTPRQVKPHTTTETQNTGGLPAKKNTTRQPIAPFIPVLPIRNAVLFPGMVVPLTVGRTISRKMLDSGLPSSKQIAVFTQKNDPEGEPKADDLFPIGVTATVLRTVKQDEDTMVVIVNVLDRVRLKDSIGPSPWLKVRVETLASIAPKETPSWKAEIATLRDGALKLIDRRDDVPDQVNAFIRNLEDAGKLADFIAGGIEMDVPERLDLLGELNVEKRVRKVALKVASQLHIADLQEKIQKDVQSHFGDMQRRAWLTEQKKAIEKELNDPDGEGDTEEEETLAAKLKAAKLPKLARAQADRELRRLESTPNGSPEASVITTYLETLAALPWAKKTEDNLDLDRARRVLDRDHFGLEKVKRRLIEHLAVRKLNPKGRSPILLLVGPPGVGKTSLGKSVARALNRKFARLSLGGVRDEADIRGHRRTYIGAMPGRLINELRRAESRNPLILLDEVDKLGGDFRGDPASALLEVLDPAQNHTFTDHYIDLPFDLSQVFFIATANTTDSIPAALRDRMEIIEITSYTAREKKSIATKYLLPRQRKEHGLKVEHVKVAPDAIDHIIAHYAREAGVRELERQLAAICRAIAAKVASGKKAPKLVDKKVVEEILGPPKYEHDEMLDIARPGVVTGLAWTSVGGGILHIEALRYPGKGMVQLTGQLGDVMKESVQTAMSLVKSRSNALGIGPKAFAQNDVHVHVPAGAVPKDGPSAGIAMFTALASLYTDQPVRADLAMTGEISLRGAVLPIGGLKEKTLAAMRAGITTILVPEANRKDSVEIPDEVKKSVELIFVKTADDVLRQALKPMTS